MVVGATVVVVGATVVVVGATVVVVGATVKTHQNIEQNVNINIVVEARTTVSCLKTIIVDKNPAL